MDEALMNSPGTPLQSHWIFLIGHRGVGKSEFLKQAQVFSPEDNFSFIDLDAELARAYGSEVFQLVETDEAQFRSKEQEAFAQLLKNQDGKCKTIVLCLGAGFLGELPQASTCLWLRRRTDGDGRVFIDRPRLNKKVDPITEYKQLFDERELRYAKLSTDQLVLREGVKSWSPLEAKVWETITRGSEQQLGGYVALLPSSGAQNILENAMQVMRWGPERLELRDDLLTFEQIQSVFEELPRKKLLLSFRKSPLTARETAQSLFGTAPMHNSDLKHLEIDWPVEWGLCPFAEPSILSFHGTFKDFESRGRELLENQTSSHLKVAVTVQDFSELKKLYRWYEQDKQNRSVLPMSQDGRWMWFRQLMSRQMKVQFWQQGYEVVSDQPTLLECMAFSMTSGPYWAAVLGDPVKHSWTPAFHQEFFAAQKASVTRVPLPEWEMTPQTLQFLYELGLRWAAVTSPLKKKAYALATNKSETVEMYQSANTLFWKSKDLICAHMTDGIGIQSQKKLVADGPVIVWGGGGLKTILQTVFPNAVFVSARQGLLENEIAEFKTLIWAAPRKSGIQKPSPNIQFKVLIDLNYSESSMGREIAVERGCQYVSGESLFAQQALAQQEFWRKMNN